jgi:WD40 repeat protein
VEVYRVALWSGGSSAASERNRAESDSPSDALASSTPSSTNARLCASLSHPGPVHDLDWNTVGTTLATSAADGVVRVWAANMQTGAWETRARLVGE